MEVVSGKDLIWDVEKYDVILVGTSIYNMLTQGFQSKMAVKYPTLVEANNSTNYADTRKFGKRITVDTITPKVSLLYICGYPHKKRDYLNYEALEHTLQTANMEFRGKKVACPILGTSLFDGNGNKERCLEIIKENLKDVDLTVYDFPQYNRREEIAMVLSKWNVLRENKEWDKYNELLRHKNEIIAKLYLKH